MIFGPEDMQPLQTPRNYALVIKLKVATIMVRQIRVDTRSLVDIITLEYSKKLQYNKKELEAAEAPVVGFEEQAPYPLKTKRLQV